MRITRVYTGKGDQGTTRLGGGTKVSKDHPRVTAYGAVDLANSVLGCARSALSDSEAELDPILEDIQHRLFDVGAVLCCPGMEDHAFTELLEQRTRELENLMDGWFEKQGPLEEFILPGGTQAASALHLARCEVRRSEQLTTTLNRNEPIPPAVLMYLNRLSDALFVMAREANRLAGVSDVIWKPASKKEGNGKKAS